MQIINGTAMVTTGSRAGVDWPGLRDQALLIDNILARSRRGKSLTESIRSELGFQTAIKARDGAPVEGAGSRALYSESRADVVAQHLCGPSGTDRSSDDGGCVGLMEDKRQ